MSEAANAEIARRLWMAASQGDPQAVLELGSDVRWRSLGAGPQAGEFTGLDAVLRYLASAGEGVQDLRSELLDILASERAALIHYRVEATRGPKRLSGQFFLWLRIDGGVVREVAAVPWDQADNDAFWRLD